MKYQTLGRTHTKVSELCLGIMTFGQQVGESNAHAQLDLATAHGVNFVDTAEMYPFPAKPETQGESERILGRWMARRLLGVAIVQLNFVVTTLIASGQPAGSLTAIKVAWAVMTMPQVVIAQAIAIAALPTFSAQIARNAPDEMRTSLAATLRGVLLLSMPATCVPSATLGSRARSAARSSWTAPSSSRDESWPSTWISLPSISRTARPP